MTYDKTNVATEIEQILTDMSNNFYQQDHSKYSIDIKEAFEEFPTLPSPSSFNRSQKNLEESIRQKTIIKAFLEREGVNPFKVNISHVYTNFDFYKSFMRAKITGFEGSGCCVDKVSSILNLYVQNKISIAKNEYTIFEKKDEEFFDKWNLPVLGSLELWFELVEGLNYFYSGHTERYENATKELVLFYESTDQNK